MMSYFVNIQCGHYVCVDGGKQMPEWHNVAEHLMDCGADASVFQMALNTRHHRCVCRGGDEWKQASHVFELQVPQFTVIQDTLDNCV